MTKMRLLIVALLALPAMVGAQVEVTGVRRGADTVTLEWRGQGGPYLVQTSSDLAAWSDVGELRTGTNAVVAAYGERAFHRVVDLDPDRVRGGLFGLVQTDQGEFGALMGRHRLKTRAWFWKTKAAPHTGGAYVPSAYWRKLVVDWQTVQDGRVQTWSGPLESLGAIATPGTQLMTVTWTNGVGADQRVYTLSLEFPYPVNGNRTAATLCSDPRYTLKCAYASDQPELNLATFTLKGTRSDSADLIELVNLDALAPGARPPVRKYAVDKGGVRVDLHFQEGMPLREGSPPWILKTFSLDRWLSPTSIASTPAVGLPTLKTDSYFARTLSPGHHNFFAEVLIEPDLDPALSEAVRSQLRARNVRHVYTNKDLAGVFIEENFQDIRFFGYDGTVRKP